MRRATIGLSEIPLSFAATAFAGEDAPPPLSPPAELPTLEIPALPERRPAPPIESGPPAFPSPVPCSRCPGCRTFDLPARSRRPRPTRPGSIALGHPAGVAWAGELGAVGTADGLLGGPPPLVSPTDASGLDGPPPLVAPADLGGSGPTMAPCRPRGTRRDPPPGMGPPSLSSNPRRGRARQPRGHRRPAPPGPRTRAEPSGRAGLADAASPRAARRRLFGFIPLPGAGRSADADRVPPPEPSIAGLPPRLMHRR